MRVATGDDECSLGLSITGQSELPIRIYFKETTGRYHKPFLANHNVELTNEGSWSEYLVDFSSKDLTRAINFENSCAHEAEEEEKDFSDRTV